MKKYFILTLVAACFSLTFSLAKASDGPLKKVFAMKAPLVVYMNQKTCDRRTNACFRSQLQILSCAVLTEIGWSATLQCGGSMQFTNEQGKITGKGFSQARTQIAPDGSFEIQDNSWGKQFSFSGKVLNNQLTIEKVIVRETSRSTPIVNLEAQSIDLVVFSNSFDLHTEIRWCTEETEKQQAYSGLRIQATNHCLNHFYTGASLMDFRCQSGQIKTTWQCSGNP